MTQLLSMGFSRLFKNKLFWFGLLLQAGFFVFLIIANYRDTRLHPDYYHYTSDTLMFAPFMISGLFASCFTGMFLGSEFSYGTVRNKLVIGKSRAKVYLAHLIVTFAASLIVNIASILVTFSVGIFLFGTPELATAKMLMIFGLGILMLAAFAGIFTLISTLITSRSAGSVINLLLFLVLIIASTYIMSRLAEPEMMMPSFVMSIDGVIQPTELVPNPYYLQGTVRTVFEFFRDLLPTCQGNQLMTHEIERPLMIVLCTLALTACTTVSGIFHFCHKDLK